MHNLIAKFIGYKMTSGDFKRLKIDTDIPTNITTYYDINYLGDGLDEHCLDVHYPNGTTKKLPTIFNIHGGGFFCGDKKIYHNYCLRLAECGYTVVNINYGLCPKYVFPQNLQNVVSALNFLPIIAQDNYIDLDNIFVIGDSAGGNLASTIGLIASNADFASKLEMKLNVKIKALGLGCSVLDTTNTNSLAMKMMREMYFGKRSKKITNLDLFNIFSHLSTDFPPTFITSCNDDFLQADNYAMVEHLKKHNIDYIDLIFDESHNPLGHVFQYRWIHNDGKVMPEAVLVRETMLNFFKKHTSD